MNTRKIASRIAQACRHHRLASLSLLGACLWLTDAPVACGQVSYPRMAFQQELGKSDPALSSRQAESAVQKPEELPAKVAKPATPENTPLYAPAPTAPPAWQLPVHPGSNCNYNACNLPPQHDAPVGRCQPCIRAIDCANSPYPQVWRDALPYNFGPLAHGEHIGPVRLPSLNQQRLRVNDKLRFVYFRNCSMQNSPYRLMVGDELMIESVTDDKVRQGDLATRGVQIQPDGFLYLKQVGSIRAEGLTLQQLRRNLEQAYLKIGLKNPAIDVMPVKTNVKLDAVLAAVDTRGNVSGGQTFQDSVHSDGTVRLPQIGSICVLGMSLDELKREVNLRYAEEVWGLQIDVTLEQEAPHFVFVYGEVNKPDRYQLQGPTNVTEVLAMAGGIKVGGNARSIVIFRRTEDWRIVATQLDLRGEHIGRVLTPKDDIWLRDNDLIIVPPMPIKIFDNFVKLVFTDGIYGIVPFNGFSITRFQQAGIN